MCGTGDINVQDFKAHAVIVGGSWHFREKVSPQNSVCVSFQQHSGQWRPLLSFSATAGDEVVLGRGVQLHPGGAGSSAAVHHRLLTAPPWGIQHPLPLLPDHCCPHTQHFAHCTHVVSRKTKGWCTDFMDEMVTLPFSTSTSTRSGDTKNRCQHGSGLLSLLKKQWPEFSSQQSKSWPEMHVLL